MTAHLTRVKARMSIHAHRKVRGLLEGEYASLQTGRVDTLALALDDRLHQPYRLKLFPWMPEIVSAARDLVGCKA